MEASQKLKQNLSKDFKNTATDRELAVNREATDFRA